MHQSGNRWLGKMTPAIIRPVQFRTIHADSMGEWMRAHTHSEKMLKLKHTDLSPRCRAAPSINGWKQTKRNRKNARKQHSTYIYYTHSNTGSEEKNVPRSPHLTSNIQLQFPSNPNATHGSDTINKLLGRFLLLSQ